MTEQGIINIPIPHYPQFKLRSSLTDKDPVIWAHFLEAYIQLLDYTLQDGIAKLTIKSQQQLLVFIRTYLKESYEETGKIFSLGAINPDIQRNGEILRAMVFRVVRAYSFVRLSITGESVWHFASLYAPKNIHTVRGLIDGSFKSKLNDNKKSGSISSIPVLKKYLEQRILRGEFLEKEDLSTLSVLLGQQITRSMTFTMGSQILVARHSTKNGINDNGSSNGSGGVNNTGNSSNLQFAGSFVTSDWVEFLDGAYAEGKSVHANLIKSIMVVSLISLSPAKLGKLLQNMGISSWATLDVAPLLGSLLTSSAFQELVPQIRETIPFLQHDVTDLVDDHNNNSSSNSNSNNNKNVDENNSYVKDYGKNEPKVKNEDISVLMDLFPDLDARKARHFLKQYNNDSELVTDILLENPDLINQVTLDRDETEEKEQEEEQDEENYGIDNSIGTSEISAKQLESQIPRINTTKPVAKRSVYDEDDISQGNFANTNVIFGKKKREELTDADSDLKKKTLSRALRLIYEDDEDEPDDTYDDQERTTGSTSESLQSQPNSKRVQPAEDGRNQTGNSTVLDDRERFLFSVYKRDGEDSFSKAFRKSSQRQKLKKETGWSDEQVEGWLRMLLKSPRRFKIFEEDYLYGGGNPNRRSARNRNEERGSLGEKEKKEDLKSSDRNINTTPITTSTSNASNNASNNNSNNSNSNGKNKKNTNAPSTSSSKVESKRKQARGEKNKALAANHSRKSQHDKKSKQALIGMQSSS